MFLTHKHDVIHRRLRFVSVELGLEPELVGIWHKDFVFSRGHRTLQVAVF